ncbi:hypothetical protein NQ314_011230 [Rhamnusium bicolor]|uniref:Uncharacterized protein n=1 Tax=Rhamnusium bicolor TaxID=1586634 RepID=A0AAV8XKY1_9CUCU|nr:hypothetical protein NQ314_011230 [Rhamnusium bicolor]
MLLFKSLAVSKVTLQLYTVEMTEVRLEPLEDISADTSDSEDLSDSNEAKMVKQRKKQAMKKHLPFHQISETEPTQSTSKEDMEVEVSESEEWNSASTMFGEASSSFSVVVNPSVSEFEQQSSSSQVKTKQASRVQHFSKKWLSDPKLQGWIQVAEHDNMYAKCSACVVNLKAKYSELIKHANSNKHKNAVKKLKSSKQVDLISALLVADHNLSFNVIDHITKINKVNFKDSKVAESLQLGRTKCTMIIQNVLADVITNQLKQQVKGKKVSVRLDEATDASNKKLLCILIKFIRGNEIKTQVLGLKEVDRDHGTAKGEKHDQIPEYFIMFMSESIGTGLLMFLGCMGCVAEVDNPPAVHHMSSLSFGLVVLLIIQTTASKGVEVSDENLMDLLGMEETQNLAASISGTATFVNTDSQWPAEQDLTSIMEETAPKANAQRRKQLIIQDAAYESRILTPRIRRAAPTIPNKDSRSRQRREEEEDDDDEAPANMNKAFARMADTFARTLQQVADQTPARRKLVRAPPNIEVRGRHLPSEAEPRRKTGTRDEEDLEDGDTQSRNPRLQAAKAGRMDAPQALPERRAQQAEGREGRVRRARTYQNPYKEKYASPDEPTPVTFQEGDQVMARVLNKKQNVFLPAWTGSHTIKRYEVEKGDQRVDIRVDDLRPVPAGNPPLVFDSDSERTRPRSQTRPK